MYRQNWIVQTKKREKRIVLEIQLAVSNIASSFKRAREIHAFLFIGRLLLFHEYNEAVKMTLSGCIRFKIFPSAYEPRTISSYRLRIFS